LAAKERAVGRFSLGMMIGVFAALWPHLKHNDTRVKLEEYRIFIEDTSRASERRQTVSNIYVLVNTAVLTAATLVLKDRCVSDWKSVALVMPLFSIGFAASFVWRRLVSRYEQIIKQRVEELKQIEKTIPRSHKMYRSMNQAFSGQVPSFSRLEQVLPCVFMAFHALFGVAGATMLILHVGQ
jgi:hypothetical protein